MIVSFLCSGNQEDHRTIHSRRQKQNEKGGPHKAFFRASRPRVFLDQCLVGLEPERSHSAGARYFFSGNNDTFTYVDVTHGEGIYPETARWAEPDLDQAAAWMRRLLDEPTLGNELGARARQRMSSQPSLADTGRLIAELAHLSR